MLGILFTLHLKHPQIVVALSTILSNGQFIMLLLDVFKNTKKVRQIAPISFSIGGPDKRLLGFTDGLKLIRFDAALRPFQDIGLRLKSKMINYPLQMIQLELILFTVGFGFLVFFEPSVLGLALVFRVRGAGLAWRMLREKLGN